MAKKPSAKSKAQKRKGSPAHPIIRLWSTRTRFKNDSKKKREKWLSSKSHFSLLSWHGAQSTEGAYFQSWIIALKNWSSSLTIRHEKYSKENDLPQHWPRTRKDEGSWSSTLPSGPRRITQWSTANYPAVYSKLNHKTICGGVSCNKMTKKMRQWPKRPRNLPWPPKSAPAEIRNDERQAGHFLSPLVMVDFVTK